MKKTPNQLRIPSSFDLVNDHVEVEYDPTLLSKMELMGMADLEAGKLMIQTAKDLAKRSLDQQYATFLHELVHFILDKMGESELQKNEKFVETFASILHQVQKTATYD